MNRLKRDQLTIHCSSSDPQEHEEYRQSIKEFKVVRTEALRAGFKESWQNGDYQTIVKMAERVKGEIVQEGTALLIYYDSALMRTE